MFLIPLLKGKIFWKIPILWGWLCFKLEVAWGERSGSYLLPDDSQVLLDFLVGEYIFPFCISVGLLWKPMFPFKCWLAFLTCCAEQHRKCIEGLTFCQCGLACAERNLQSVKIHGHTLPLVSVRSSYRQSNSCSGRSKATHAKARKPKVFSIFFLMRYFPGYL